MLNWVKRKFRISGYTLQSLDDTYGLLKTDSQVNDRDVGGGDTESHTGQFAVRTRQSESKLRSLYTKAES